MNYYNKSTSALLKLFQSSMDGLTDSQVSLNSQKFGKNIIVLRSKPLWRRIIEPFADVFMLILLIAALISWHQNHVIDAWVILAVILINAIISYVQDYSTARILRSLNQQANQLVKVKRDSQIIELSSENLVVGDIIYLAEGDKVPADARIIQSDNARLDESMLTGESLPISKHSQIIDGKLAVYDQKNMVFAGSFVVAGNLSAIVTSTGMNTEFGKIASFAENVITLSPVQIKINELVTKIIFVVSAIMVVVFIILLFNGLDPEEAITFVLATTVSVIPEGLPIAITIILALSMRRMAKENALVRNLRSIESIGLVNIIATDKTGTLTHNKLSIINTWTIKKTQSDFFAAILGSMAVIDSTNISDPLDRAIVFFAKKKKLNYHNGQLVKIFPFDQTLVLSGAIYQKNNQFEIFIKGSPEKILSLAKISSNELELANVTLMKMIDNGGRVIAIAKAITKKPIKSLEELPKNVDFMGLIELSDPLRKEAKAAVKQAQNAGIKVVMITGDHYKTAFNIGKQLDIIHDESEVLDMSRVLDMPEQELSDRVNICSVFARVTPESKFHILQILKQNNILAMTGDGVNDTPALIEANTGIAMGSGSSIAKDASDIIILDDNFSTIVTAVKEGRTTVHNIRRVLFYLLSTNIGELLTFLAALLLRLPLPLAAVQILWVNLMTDTAFVIPLGMQPAQDNIMKSKPKSPDAPLLNRSYIVRIVLISAMMAILALTTYQLFASKGKAYAQTMTFTMLIICQWANAFNATSFSLSLLDRARKINYSMLIVLAISIILQLAVIYSPLNTLFNLTAVSINDLLIVSFMGSAVTITTVEIHKIINRWIYFQPFYK
ncbi:MAG: cation-transporting P-type ATPase [Candidatus Saccharibacteria bacterium]|nr:cation-transporting P-type ATPase [Candidatus Saccharibacteria bacterium]